MSFKRPARWLIKFLLITKGYFYLENQKQQQVVFQDTYYLLEKNTNQKKILKQLKLKKINNVLEPENSEYIFGTKKVLN